MCNMLYGNNNNRINVGIRGERVKFSEDCTHVPKHHQILIKKIMTSVTTTAHTDTHLLIFEAIFR